MSDVVVLGAGPAGTAAAGACARAGLHTVLVAPHPDRRWRPTYGLWRDELPGLPASAIASAPAAVHAIARTERAIPREYLVVDNEGLRAWLTDDRVERVRGHARQVAHGPHGSTVTLADGGRLATGVVIDATGAQRMLSGGAPRRWAEQTAYGLILPRAHTDAPPEGSAVLMDWRGAGTDPSFAYVLPLPGDRLLIEETSLARSPGLDTPVLAARLRVRLGLDAVPADAVEEKVRIPLDLPLPRPGRTVAFGVAAALVHPATGYSLAAALQLAPLVAEAIAAELHRGPAAAARSARRAIWPPRALAVHSLRRHGLRALQALPADALVDFFELFFGLPGAAQRAFTSGRTDLTGTAAAMATLFRGAPWRIRARLLR